MDKNERLAIDFAERHALYVALAQQLSARQNAHEFFIVVLATMLLTCIPEGNRRDFVTDLHALNDVMLQGADTLEFESTDEKKVAGGLVRASSEIIGSILDRIVAGLAANPRSNAA